MNPGFGWGEWELVKILRRRTPGPFGDPETKSDVKPT
jgi:hypothetical protein